LLLKVFTTGRQAELRFGLADGAELSQDLPGAGIAGLEAKDGFEFGLGIGPALVFDQPSTVVEPRGDVVWVQAGGLGEFLPGGIGLLFGG